MISYEKAKEKAKDYAEKAGFGIGGALDDGEFFIFEYSKDVDVSPIGVNKKSGETLDYFPPDHPAFLNAKPVES